MNTCLFAGPTLYRADITSEIKRFGPAAMGSIYRAVEAGYRRVGIVDGYFGNVPSVWHKEILYALAEGVEVVGAASMGALRAPELSAYGMVGVGRIYRLYRSGRFTDDDEFAVIHAPHFLEFRPLSHAMVNIRYTLRRLSRLGGVDPAMARVLVQQMKTRHFSLRTDEALSQEIRHLCTNANVDADPVIRRFASEYVDVKRSDARTLVDYLAQEPHPVARPTTWDFPSTGHWRRQFIRDIADVPQLGEMPF